MPVQLKQESYNVPSVEYTKKRDLASGSVGETATLDFTAKPEPKDNPDTDELKTMGLAYSAVYKNTLRSWQIDIAPVTYSVSNLAIWTEFLRSVAAREFFQFDPTGTAAVPGPNIYTVTMKPETWKFSRKGLGNTLMTVSMEFEETSA